MTNREQFPHFLNNNNLLGIGVELGVKQAEYSTHILNNWNGKELIMVDIWHEQPKESYNDIANVGQGQQCVHLSDTFNRIYNFGGRATIIRSDGVRASKFIADSSLDFVYIDANHHYEAVVIDIETWYPKIKIGGYLCGHDYPYPDVKKAVDEFSKKIGKSFFTSTNDWSSWFMKI